MNIAPTINRSLLLVVPKQPFYDWSNALTPDLPPTNANKVNEYNSYLLEDELFLDNPKEELRKYWKPIFLNELFGQWTDEEAYPKLSWKLFTEWFDFYKSSVVNDLTDEPLYIEHYE
ncbi:MAG: VacJ [Flavobacteriaceae bacterium]|nr:VacJ [Flavobacteriaceae bacterium]|tara:strand:- start:3386 stop:3736 length:351 start_codon:yes stop_codon:yes gene_type:complete